MFKRKVERLITKYEAYPAIALVGPRQSGKTTLAKAVFKDYEYISLENPDVRSFATEDPRGFLGSIKESCILDEIQNIPSLLSYLQEIIDDSKDKRRFILTGSNSLKLNQDISQSLAGRVRILNILPLSFEEIPKKLRPADIDTLMWKGSYPRIYDKNLDPRDWCADYSNTYLQKDIRSIVNVENLTLFERFIRVCASHCGGVSNYSTISSDVGISQPTAQKWSSMLEASFVLFRLTPHHKNFKKRIIKSPKLYFWDTGLLCYLLRISNPEQLLTHPLRGSIFENWVVSELHKQYYYKGLEPPLYYWRDQHGHEVDLIVDNSTFLFPIEIKSGATFNSSWIKSINWINNLQDYDSGQVIYGGDKSYSYKGKEVTSWKDIGSMVDVHS